MHGQPLQPIHMHAPNIIDLTDPYGTLFHELQPNFCGNWTLTSWENQTSYLIPNDQIDMENLDTGLTHWFHVDRVTMTMLLWTDYWGFDEEIYVEFKGPYIPDIQPICTNWTEIWPVYLGVTGFPYHIFDWDDTGFGNTGKLGVCDWIKFDDWPDVWWHVEEYATDLILNEKIMDPYDTQWHELYPSFCHMHNVTSWEEPTEDPYPDRLSPGDQIDMINQTTMEKKWYFVDRVTLTMRVTNETDPAQEMYIEYKGPFETMYDVKTTVINSTWHEVYPEYCPSFNITDWIDNCNGVLDLCDFVELHDLYADLYYGWWHVEELSIDIILNEKISDPVCTWWHELYPECCVKEYHIDVWEDNNFDELLSPCDNVTVSISPTGLTDEFHVENLTLTLNLSILDTSGGPFIPGDRIYIEFAWGYEWMYYAKIYPLTYNLWEVVCPTQYFGMPLTLKDWDDNCNGVLSYCDVITLFDLDQNSITAHVDELAVDMIIGKPEEPPPPPPPQLYWKENYTEYAPTGVPDFDQRQDNWNLTSPIGGPWWTWCAPTAVANSLWWMDSRFHPSNLLTAYLGALGEHDPSNVQPFIQHLAWLMDTDAQRTGVFHRGTWTWDMETGIAQYLSWSGVNPLGDVNGDGIVDMKDYHLVNSVFNGSMPFDIYADIWPETVTGPYTADNVVNQSDLDLVTAHMGETGKFYEHTLPMPDFYLVAEEVYRCEDVVLVLGFWTYNPDTQKWNRVGYPDTPYEEIGLGHAVTVAGINSTSAPPLIAISDPANDAFEAGLTPGRSPVNHTHMPPEPPYTTHNNASLVSHDIYNVTFVLGCPGGTWALQGYVGNPQAGAPPGAIAVVEYAVITSPLEVEVCGVDITNVVPWFKGKVMYEAYPSWDININVTVHNNGTTPTNCTVNAYYFNVTTNQIGTPQNITNLAPSNSVNLTFIWDLKTIPENSYHTLKANATCICGGKDEFVNGQVWIRPWGDINGIGGVSIADVKIMDLIYSGISPNPDYDIWGDINGDCNVSIADVKIMDLIYSGIPPPIP